MIALAPLALGPFGLDRLTLEGAVHATALLLSIGIAVPLARRRAIRPRLVVEAHALAVPLVLAGAHARSLVDRFPAFLHDGSLLADALLAPADVPLAVGMALAALAVAAWASGRPRDLLDAVAPGAVVLAIVALADFSATGARGEAAALAAIGLAGAFAAWKLAASARREGEPSLVAAETVALACAVAWSGGRTLALALHAGVLGVLVGCHVALHARRAEMAARATG